MPRCEPRCVPKNEPRCAPRCENQRRRDLSPPTRLAKTSSTFLSPPQQTTVPVNYNCICCNKDCRSRFGQHYTAEHNRNKNGPEDEATKEKLVRARVHAMVPESYLHHPEEREITAGRIYQSTNNNYPELDAGSLELTCMCCRQPTQQIAFGTVENDELQEDKPHTGKIYEKGVQTEDKGRRLVTVGTQTKETRMNGRDEVGGGGSRRSKYIEISAVEVQGRRRKRKPYIVSVGDTRRSRNRHFLDVVPSSSSLYGHKTATNYVKIPLVNNYKDECLCDCSNASSPTNSHVSFEDSPGPSNRRKRRPKKKEKLEKVKKKEKRECCKKKNKREEKKNRCVIQ